MAQLSPPKLRRAHHLAPAPVRGDGRRSTPRFLITVTVLGSAGPIRFVVGEGDRVAAVISTALKSYAREGRRPVLGSDLDNFLLYAANAGSDALSPREKIGPLGSRNFVLCKKQGAAEEPTARTPARSPLAALSWKSGGSWKAWINKSFSFKISSH